MPEYYDPNATKKNLPCILNGCRPCNDGMKYCHDHGKPAGGLADSIPGHCKECGEFILNKSDRRGLF